MNKDIAGKLGYPENIDGLVVIEIERGSQAAGTIVRHGDLLMEINHHKVSTTGEYKKHLGKIDKGETAQLLFRRGNSHVFVINFKKP